MLVRDRMMRPRAGFMVNPGVWFDKDEIKVVLEKDRSHEFTNSNLCVCVCVLNNVSQ